MKKLAIILFVALMVVIYIPVNAYEYIICSGCKNELWEDEPYLYYQTDNGEKIYLCPDCIYENMHYMDSFIPSSTDLISCDRCGSKLDPNHRDYTTYYFDELKLKIYDDYLYDEYGDVPLHDISVYDIDLVLCDACLHEERSGYGYALEITPNSTAFSSISYKKNSKILTVTFRDSKAEYEYKDFPYIEWLKFCDADSLGSYYNEFIKGQYECEKIN